MASSFLRFSPYRLELSSPFGTAHGVRSHTDIMIVAIGHQSVVGYGEAAMPPYYSENQESMAAFFNRLSIQKIMELGSPEEVHDYLIGISTEDSAARAAIDIAYHDWLGKLTAEPIVNLSGVNSNQDILSSYTIGASDEQEMMRKVRQVLSYPILKIKLNGTDDIKILKSIRQIYKGDIWIDANQAWDTIEYATQAAKEMEALKISMIEQPFKIGNLELVKQLSTSTHIPIIADEDCQNLESVDALADAYDGINIKLMKCSGIYEAMRMIEKARSLDLNVMLGCMTETSIGISAAAQLAPLVDWCDLDGNLLIDNDVCDGAKMVNGIINLDKTIPGIGLSKTIQIDQLLGIS